MDPVSGTPETSVDGGQEGALARLHAWGHGLVLGLTVPLGHLVPGILRASWDRWMEA